MTADPAAPLGARELLRNRTFLLFQARGNLSGISYALYLGAILWLTYRLSGGILLAGLVIGVQTVVFTLTFLVSPLVDRVYDKRWVFVVCYPLQASLVLALAGAYAFGRLTLPVLFGVVVLLAFLWDLTEAADQTTTRLLFGKNNLFMVSGLGGAIGGSVNLLLYLAGGLVLGLFGAAGGLTLIAAIFGAGTALALPLPIPTPKITVQTWWKGFREGWELFRGEQGRVLREFSLLQFVVGLLVAAPTLLLTLDVGRFFTGSQTVYAELYVAYLVGGILVGLLLGYLNPRGALGPITIAALFGTGLALLGAQIAVVSLGLSVAVWFALGGTNAARSSGTWTYLQGKYEPEVLARVSMNTYLFAGVGSAIGAFLIGELSVTWTPAALTDLVALGFMGSALLGLLLSRIRGLAY